MDQIEFRKLKESGENVTDAALQSAETEVVDDQFANDQPEPEVDDTQEQNASSDAQKDADSDDGDEPDQLTEKERNAFQKRMERESKKIEERLRKELEEQTEQKYSKHREAIEALGGDPDKLLAAAREARINTEAQRLAEQNGWSDEETRWYVDQQKQQQELKELRVQMQINRLKDQSDYLGIDKMERELLAKIDKSNGALSVEEAYWALGGPKKAAQLKLEAEQREIARRSQPARTVQSDAPSTQIGEKPLPPQVLRDAKMMGISEAEARRLFSSQPAGDIDEWRARKSK